MGTGPVSCVSRSLCSTHQNAPAPTFARGNVVEITSEQGCWHCCYPLPSSGQRGELVAVPLRAGGTQGDGVLCQLMGGEWLPHVHPHHCCQTKPSLGKAPFLHKKLMLPLSSLSKTTSLRMLPFLSAG